MQERKVDGCPVCKPISALLDLLLKKGFKIVEQKISDYHFHELYFKLNHGTEDLETVEIEGIEKLNNNNCLLYTSPSPRD